MEEQVVAEEVVAEEVVGVVEDVEVTDSGYFTPKRITIQWHVTNVCNYRCAHCYQDDYADSGADYMQLLSYYRNIYAFAEHFKKLNDDFNAHINFTGGEPFLKPELLKLLEIITNEQIFSFGILSNGYLLPPQDLQTLALLKPRFIQLSLEGDKTINDSIRGNGSYNQVIKAINTYQKLNIPVILSFTANAFNYKYFPHVVSVARRYKVHKVWTDRYLPIRQNDNLTLCTDQVKAFFETIRKEKNKRVAGWFSNTIISSSRALQFLENGGLPYACSAGKTLLALLPNGDVLPCRRLPINIGNLKNDMLLNIYNNNHILDELHSFRNIDEHCKQCYYAKSCNGGLKCLSYALTGNFSKKDPNCWI